MSYILDALKKSAEERRRAQAAASLPYGTPLPLESTGRKRRTGVLLVSLCLCLCGLAGAAWYWRYKTHSSADSVEKLSAPVDPATLQQAAPTSTADVEIPPAAATVANIPAPARTESPHPDPSQQQTPPSPVATSAPTVIPPLFDDLPADLKKAIPNVRFSGHVYSLKPDLRMIMADQAIVREQDLITADLRLTAITETGVLLNYRGTDFRIELLPPLN
ncbi:general secretion pathway protein GspB [Desulfofustis limnaeus]|jgi:hypothetical protein|uniref:Type II secretion system protein GspB C-terminal domain-containing protein n=1 Tax=Desulfofustis limnaeus TaxID=2740163 RepID=A0ABM7W6B7_9BACT|nr:general secretion pathway protein GspB [Desulfofustis limnaeus]MDX9896298.1 general secretion pathway protein GspB [Desulfofustis sp.]BDD86481.1 hypothetical protein DPPLL_08460 [Desulfofustis limnaeus]